MKPFFSWSIQRFGTLPLIPGNWLQSPIFYADSSKVAKFCFRLQGMGFPSNSNGHVAKLFFCRCDTDGPENVEVEYTINLDCGEGNWTYKRIFLKPEQGAYQSYETDVVLLKTSDILNELTIVCMILSYDDDKYSSSGVIDKTDFDALSHDFNQMFLKSEFSDVVIRIQNHEFNVHKAVLGVRCPELLKECQVKNRQKITQNCGEDCIRMLLRYIYNGKIFPRDVPDDFYLLLNKYNDSIFEQLFLSFSMGFHTRTAFEVHMTLIKWEIKSFLMYIQNKEYRYIIAEGEPSTWFSIIFLEDKAKHLEVVMRKMCKKTISFVQCKISVHPDVKENSDATTIFTGNHLFNDEHPWKVQLDYALRTTCNDLESKPKYFSISINVTDGKPTNSVECVGFSLISDSHRHAAENLFELSRDMGKLYKNTMHSDVTLIIKDKRIPAHKAILSARSSRFRETLQRNSFLAEIPINDLDEDVALSMIYYIYNAQVDDLDTGLALELYKAANLYEILPLKIKCSRYLELYLTASNFGEILLFADAQNDSELKKFVYKFIITHPSDVLESKQSMGILRSYHDLHLDALKQIYTHLAKKV